VLVPSNSVGQAAALVLAELAPHGAPTGLETLIQALARAYTGGVCALSSGGGEAKEQAATHGFFALIWV
jgi:hypothetical protein